MEKRVKERRRDVRVTFQSRVKLVFGAGVFDDCETRNISVSGVFVEGVSGVEKGDRCAVEFRLIGRTSTLVMDMSGEVVRVDPDGVALQFFDVDRDSFCHLKNIVYFNYKNPAELGDDYQADDVDDTTVYLSPPSYSELVAAEDADDYDGFDDAGDIDLDLVSRVRAADDDESFD
jgi:hypothetical protein